jgi:hypothetical protein
VPGAGPPAWPLGHEGDQPWWEVARGNSEVDITALATAAVTSAASATRAMRRSVDANGWFSPGTARDGDGTKSAERS